MDKYKQVSLGHNVAKAVKLLNIKSQIQENTQIHGHINTDLGSQTFNTSGTTMAILPLERPFPQKEEKICIWDTVKKEVCLTLDGHTDAIMCVGFNPDDRLIGSASWFAGASS